MSAPELRETADIWWDSGTDPVIRWDAMGRRFWLVDGADSSHRLVLLALERTPGDAVVVATALRQGLAACDFPPTGGGVGAERAAATLRAAGVQI